MNDGPQANRFRLAAGGVQLLLRERRFAAGTEAGGGEDFDFVGAGGFELANLFANLIHGEFRVV